MHTTRSVHDQLRLLLIVALASTLIGCSTLRGTPQRYAEADEIVRAIDLTPTNLAQLVVTMSEAERNALQSQAIAVIDLQFHQFVQNLVADRANAAAGESHRLSWRPVGLSQTATAVA